MDRSLRVISWEKWNTNSAPSKPLGNMEHNSLKNAWTGCTPTNAMLRGREIRVSIQYTASDTYLWLNVNLFLCRKLVLDNYVQITWRMLTLQINTPIVYKLWNKLIMCRNFWICSHRNSGAIIIRLRIVRESTLSYP